MTLLSRSCFFHTGLRFRTLSLFFLIDIDSYPCLSLSLFRWLLPPLSPPPLLSAQPEVDPNLPKRTKNRTKSELPDPDLAPLSQL